jgi:hypothetical protein
MRMEGGVVRAGDEAFERLGRDWAPDFEAVS